MAIMYCSTTQKTAEFEGFFISETTDVLIKSE